MYCYLYRYMYRFRGSVYYVNTVLFPSSATGTESKTLYRAEAAGQRTEARVNLSIPAN